MPRRRPGVLRHLEVSILSALSGSDSAAGIHGFALAQAIADENEARRLTATGSLYRVLHRLDDGGLIENWWEDPNDAAVAGRPRRRLYRITAAGATALATNEPVTDSDRQPMRRIDPGYAS